jgi:hypothetical protein
MAAAHKVGTTPRQRLAWLACDFAQRTSFADMNGGAVPEGSAFEVAVFILFESGAGSVDLGQLPPLSAKWLDALAREVREGLDQFIDGGKWELNVSQRLVRRLVRRVRPLPPNVGELEVASTWSVANQSLSPAAFRIVFLMAAFDLLLREGHTLTRCHFHDCKSLFIQEDPRQKYCSTSHAHRDRQYRYRTGRAVGEGK